MSTAWVTLATTNGYAIGALVLAQSLRNVKTKHKIHILCTSEVSVEMREQLKKSFDEVTEVEVMNSYDAENLALIDRPDLGVTFTKLHCWRLTQYTKCVFLDADTFVVKNSDELFDHPEFAAAPDIGWPDFFNSGVFVFVPSQITYQNLVQFGVSHGSFDGGDQGLLNSYFSNWRASDASHRLSFLYNVTANAIYSYAAAIKRHAADIKIIHFLGKQKPWHHTTHGEVSQHLKQWQETYTEAVQHCLPTSIVGPSSNNLTMFNRNTNSSKGRQTSPPKQTQQRAVSFIQKKITEETLPIIGSQLKEMEFSTTKASTMASAPPKQTEEEKRYDAWEHGQPDYKGDDAFANIQKFMEKSLQ